MSTLQQGQSIHGFTVSTIEPVSEISGTAYIMLHAATGAQLLYLDTEDEEKGFAIGFRTHPADNTGVFHILEHSVLCGSDKYPVKEPFVHLLKSSMKTFLNAATAPDCTMYPAACTNEKDLMNLMSVYLDAVFHPAILREPRIFKQEGWHYEYDGESLEVNGVVYNEMKGLLSQPAVALRHALNEELFPDTSYRFNAGGAPKEIETLSYERFIDTYRRHYKPGNAAIVLYGHLDLEPFLAAINEQLLSALSETETNDVGDPNPCGMQTPIVSTGRKVYLNALPQDAEIRFGSVFADADDARRALAMEILGYALLGTNEAPLTRMLLDTGIAPVFTFGIDCASKHFLTVSARNVKPDSAQAFIEALRDGCRQLLSQGVDKDLLKAAEFQVEFRKRTGDRNVKPSAADQMMACLSEWGAECPLDAEAIRYSANLEFLKSAIETDYYDQLLREAILESTHYALVELCPIDEGLEDARSPKPHRTASDFDADELERIAREAADLKAFQSAPDSPEALKSIPQLDRSDCIEAPYYAGYRLVEEESLSVLRHEYAEDGLAHIMRYYDILPLSLEDFRYLETLIWIISQTDTLRHDVAEVLRLRNGRLGSINSNISISTDELDGSLGAYVWVYTCSLANDIEFTSDYIDEILHETVFRNREKLREIIDMQWQNKKAMVVDAMPHIMASMRASAHISESAALNDVYSGSENYWFLKELKTRCEDDAEADKVLRRLEILCARVFGKKPALISFSGDDDAYERFINAEQSIISKYEKRAAETLSNLSDEERAYANHPTLAEVQPVSCGDEAFIIPGDVAHCALAVDVSDTPSFKSGYWAVANRAAKLDYLWNEIRVKGGAYGADFTESKKGTAEFWSFRDPNIDDTLLSFSGLSKWLREFDPSDDELDGYVISATAAFDKPSKGFSRVFSQSQSHLFGWTLEDRKRRRQEIVSCTADDVRRLGKELDECTGKRYAVVFGGRELIEQSEHDFVEREIE